MAFLAMERLWLIGAVINTAVFLSLPTTAATSSWRPVVGATVASSAGLSLVLLVLGCLLRERAGRVANHKAVGVASLLVSGLPFAFYGFFWLIGPLY
jgi:hypothetical protein